MYFHRLVQVPSFAFPNKIRGRKRNSSRGWNSGIGNGVPPTPSNANCELRKSSSVSLVAQRNNMGHYPTIFQASLVQIPWKRNCWGNETKYCQTLSKCGAGKRWGAKDTIIDCLFHSAHSFKEDIACKRPFFDRSCQWTDRLLNAHCKYLYILYVYTELLFPENHSGSFTINESHGMLTLLYMVLDFPARTFKTATLQCTNIKSGLRTVCLGDPYPIHPYPTCTTRLFLQNLGTTLKVNRPATRKKFEGNRHLAISMYLCVSHLPV